jgi:hypothetical protein
MRIREAPKELTYNIFIFFIEVHIKKLFLYYLKNYINNLTFLNDFYHRERKFTAHYFSYSGGQLPQIHGRKSIMCSVITRHPFPSHVACLP